MANQSKEDKRYAYIQEARKVLRGSRKLDSAELEDLYKNLEGLDQFSYATEILLVKMEMDEADGKLARLKEFQKLAGFIYKDYSLPSSFKFNKALNELTNHEDLKITTNCETLGLAGAIYKRKWLYDNQFRNLILSRYYYGCGYNVWKNNLDKQKVPQNDNGYCAINFAFINELMSVVKLNEHGSETGISDSIIHRLEEAKQTRVRIITELEQLNYRDAADEGMKWVLQTLIEAYIGTENYEQAAEKIQLYGQRVVKAENDHANEYQLWEKRTLIKQLLTIYGLKRSLLEFDAAASVNTSKENKEKFAAYIKDVRLKKFEGQLQVLVGGNLLDEDIETGKIGLALSGGGFRAAFFQIGVLAALAENDVLRKIEVLSCVSGGSILGAYYYLKLKKMLEENSDKQISEKGNECYIKLVQEIEADFFNAVKQNLRMQILSSIGINFKMLVPQWKIFKWINNKTKVFQWLFPNKYSRTHRLGELYEKYLYAPLLGAGRVKEHIYINNLYIKPDKNERFVPAVENWTRQNKVPQLILNCTSLNTGHNWQFTASWMGEPPGNIEPEIDAKKRLRRMYYKDAPGAYKNFRLGYAVAASSCVPVMFEPLAMNELYPGINLQLVDGGVHDNQGIAALIGEECKSMIIADGSGQMPLNPEASKGVLGNFYRADSILQERIRELQFLDVQSRNYTTLVKNLLIVHLKSDLHKPPQNWIYCEDPPRTIIDTNNAVDNKDLTSYGILLDSQQLLSEIRTDLDAFSEMEAYGLMLSGYKQTMNKLRNTNFYTAPATTANTETGDAANKSDTAADANAGDTPTWKFLAAEEFYTDKAKADFVKQHLKESHSVAFKALQVTSVKVIVGIFAVLISLGIITLCWYFWNASIEINFAVKALVYSAITILIGILLGFINALLKRIWGYKTTIRKWLIQASLLMIFAVICWLYLKWFNKKYLKSGDLAVIKMKYADMEKRIQPADTEVSSAS
ncbi:MAG: patatin-like phospholipase family protein [Bacteroidetes bacterium]|nr:patatin-like phospholipase family protein [Bacteroidota bacterium]